MNIRTRGVQADGKIDLTAGKASGKLNQDEINPTLPGERIQAKVNNGRSSCGYFQFGTDNNTVALQTVGRFKGFYRCSVDFGNAAQGIAGFDHVKSLGLAGGHCILL